MQEAEPAGRRTRVDEKGAAFQHALGLPGVAFHACTSRAHAHCMHARMSHVFSPCALFVSPLRSRQVTPRMQPLP